MKFAVWRTLAHMPSHSSWRLLPCNLDARRKDPWCFVTCTNASPKEERTMKAYAQTIVSVALAVVIAAGSQPARADLKPLRTAPVPLPANLGNFVVDRTAAI